MGSEHGTSVWFADAVRDGGSELFVETPDRFGITLRIATAILTTGVRILRSETRIIEGLARDWYLVAEADGRPIGSARREQVRAQIVAAIVALSQQSTA
jgi:UTP:GlnB (protein PII) uridylyltransferase